MSKSVAPIGLADWMNTALLVLILAIGIPLRFLHADWDDGNQLHPDERGILFVEQNIILPSDLKEALSPVDSPLNPYRNTQGAERLYPYGNLPLYLNLAAEQFVNQFCPALSVCGTIPPDSFVGRLLNVSALPRFNHLTYVGRAMSALYDSLTILATFLLARELYNTRAGLLAAAFGALAVLHIQNAHFGTVDTALALFVTLSLWLLARYARTELRRDSVLAGICVGLALGTKATAILLIMPALAAHLRLLRHERGPLPLLRLADPQALWLTLLAIALTFTLTNPYALLDPAPAIDSLATQTQMASGNLDWPFTRQYIGTPPVWYYVVQQARWTLGFPLTFASYAGLIWAAYHAVKARTRAESVILAWAGTMLIVIGSQQVKFPRYMLPLTPALFCLAAGMLTIPFATLPDEPRGKRAHASLRFVCILCILVPTALYALAFTHMYAQPHPWVAASEWVYHNLPAKTALAVERGDDALPLDIVLDGQIYLRDTFFDTRILDPFAEPDDAAKLDALLDKLAESDYLILSSDRLYGVIPRLGERYPLTAAYYRALFAGDLGFKLVQAFSRYPALWGWMLVDDPFSRPGLTNPLRSWPANAISLGHADESFTVYDHPLVLVFRNEGHLSMAQLRAGVLARLAH